MTDTTDPRHSSEPSGPLDWAKPGALCAVVHQIGFTGDRAPIIKDTRVLRVTKTQVVVLTDDRFSRSTGARIGERRDAWGSSRMNLYAEGSPELAAAREKAERIRIGGVARRLADAGLDLMDVRELALLALDSVEPSDDASRAMLASAERVTKVVGGHAAPNPDEAPEPHVWIKEKRT